MCHLDAASLIKKENDMARPDSTIVPGGEGRAAERRLQDPMREQLHLDFLQPHLPNGL